MRIYRKYSRLQLGDKVRINHEGTKKLKGVFQIVEKDPREDKCKNCEVCQEIRCNDMDNYCKIVRITISKEYEE